MSGMERHNRRLQYEELPEQELIKMARKELTTVDYYFYLRTQEGRAALKKDGRTVAPIKEMEPELRAMVNKAYDILIVLERKNSR